MQKQWVMTTYTDHTGQVTNLTPNPDPSAGAGVSPVQQVVEATVIFGVAAVVAHTIFELAWPWAMVVGITPLLIMGVVAFVLAKGGLGGGVLVANG